MTELEKIKQEYQDFNETVLDYTASQDVVVEKKCFAYEATNLGDTIVNVNGHTLFPSATPATDAGDSYAVVAPDGQVFKGRLNISFRVPLGATPLVQLTQLFYLEDNQKIFK